MPFIVTEPQRIEGTRLGYAVYSYHFSFEDHIEFEKKYDRKLMIFKLKDTPFAEVDKVLHEEKFRFVETNRGFVDSVLKSFICQNGHYVCDFEKMDKYFQRTNNYNLVGVQKEDVKEKR